MEETRISQEKIIKGAEDTKAIVTELAYAAAVITMVENKMIRPAYENKIIDESITTIEDYSERLGKLTKLINEFRINEQSQRW